MGRVMRSVVNSEYCGASRYTGYIDKSVRLKLECGHELFRKASTKVPQKAHCVECAREAERTTP